MKQVAIFKQYDGSISMLMPSQEALNLGRTIEQVAASGIPKPVKIPKVADEKQSLVKIYDRPNSVNKNLQRFNYINQNWENVVDDSGQTIAVIGAIEYSYNFLIIDRSELPSGKFFSAWEVEDSALTSGVGKGEHPEFYTDWEI